MGGLEGIFTDEACLTVNQEEAINADPSQCFIVPSRVAATLLAMSAILVFSSSCLTSITSCADGGHKTVGG